MRVDKPYLVYDTMRDSWTEFYFGRDYIGGDTGVIIQAVSLTAGDTLENSNLLGFTPLGSEVAAWSANLVTNPSD